MYHLSDLVPHGANTMVEVIRQALVDVTVILQEKGLKMPDCLSCHFDNSGENKNAPVICYLTMLVELNEFTTISVNFLIVGHTHCIIDQWFSVVSRIINSQNFIGTPWAMKNLLSLKDDLKKYRNPKIQKFITHVYDFGSAIKPYMNKNIHFYQVSSSIKLKIDIILNCRYLLLHRFRMSIV